ncbi:hypothetical protein K438DRAFT_1761150 [Mycena galopus ATCC 62051]|nr:hypothetical protein K438DRAFT_1761150 [Mycena galopus ATCC 62051]
MSMGATGVGATGGGATSVGAHSKCGGSDVRGFGRRAFEVEEKEGLGGGGTVRKGWLGGVEAVVFDAGLGEQCEGKRARRGIGFTSSLIGDARSGKVSLGRARLGSNWEGGDVLGRGAPRNRGWGGRIRGGTGLGQPRAGGDLMGLEGRPAGLECFGARTGILTGLEGRGSLGKKVSVEKQPNLELSPDACRE